MESSVTQRKNERENFWLKQLKMVYVHVLDKELNKTDKNDNNSMNVRNFSPMFRISSWKTRGIKHININK